jgi:hypothetical protein
MATLNVCPKCGAAVSETGSRFCMVCGTSLTLAVPLAQAQPAPVPEPARPPGASETSQPRPEVKPAKTPAGDKRQAPSAPAARPRTGFRVISLRTVFGIFDLIAIVLAIGALAYLRFKPTVAQCPPLAVPSSHTVADSRRTQSGNLSGFVVFRGGETYMIAENQVLTVPEGGTLFVEPGARLQFGKGSALDVRGQLHACGNSSKPIIFTSDLDDPKRTGGATAKAGDWIGIRFYDESDDKSVMGHVQIRFAGRDSHGALHLGKASPTLSEVTISDSKAFPISMDPSAEPALSGKIEFTNTPMRGIEIRGGQINNDTTWEANGSVYVVTGNVFVSKATRLTIKPNVIVKFASDAGLEVEGALMASGTTRAAPKVGEGGSIVFTSLKDDEATGDSDMRAAVAEAGDWSGILLRGSGSRSTIHGAVIRYAGKNRRAAIHIAGASPEITGNRIEQSAWYAISADPSAQPKIKGNVLNKITEGIGMEVRGGTLGSRDTWRWLATDNDMVRVVTGNLNIGRDGVLEIGAGTIVRFARDIGIEVNGALRILGEESKPVILTSSRDDASDAGGDVDGSAARPAAGDWTGIRFNRESNDRLSQIQQAKVRYAAVGIRLTAVSPPIEAVQVTDTTGNGIACESDAKPKLTKVTFGRNGQGDTNCK